MLPSLIDALETTLSESGRNILQISEPTAGDVYSFDVSQILYIEAQRKDRCIQMSLIYRQIYIGHWIFLQHFWSMYFCS